MAWLKHEMGQGVVLTRSKTALRDGELQSASHVRMLPGNREQLYNDLGYDSHILNLREDEIAQNLFFMNFEGGYNYAVVVSDHIQGGAVGGNGHWYVFDLAALGTLDDKGVTPVLQGSFTGGIHSSTLVNRGAEYFLNVSSTLTAGGLNLPIGKGVIFYHEDGEVKVRGVGRKPSQIQIQAQRGTPNLSENVWSMTDGIATTGNRYNPGGEFYNAYTLVYNHLYGSYANLTAEWDTPNKRNSAFAQGWGGLYPNGVPPTSQTNRGDFDEPKVLRILSQMYVPISRIRLRVRGEGFVFGYWCTEYDSKWGVESAPTDITEVSGGNNLEAEWVVEIDWAAFFDTGNPYLTAWYNDVLNDEGFYGGPPDTSRSDARSLIVSDLLRRLRSAYNAGTIPAVASGTFPLTKAQEEEMVIALTLIDPLQDFRNNADDLEVRLYRQNFGTYATYLLDWRPGETVGTQTEPTGEGPRNIADARAGRINRQGGLLNSFPIADLTISTTDNIKESGTADPGFPFPTINYITRGGLGVYEYLRQPKGASACANMAQSLLRVERDNDAETGTNIILVAPVEDPEQAPLIYAIPVVTDRQDEVIDIRTLRDAALVFTSTSLLHLNYIPFEGSNQQDRVLTQITGNHGVRDNQRGCTVETPLGQVYVWLSDTALMATNGRGAWDVCPDFSVKAVTDLGYDVTNARMVNNAREHRIELWLDGTRFDFLYHRSQMKDIRGDGAGLAFKLMGPSTWYHRTKVRACASGVLEGVFRTFHITQPDGGGGIELHISSDTEYTGFSSVVMRKIWGSNPESALNSIQTGVEYTDEISAAYIWVRNSSAAKDALRAEISDADYLKLDKPRGFSSRFVEDGLGASAIYEVGWKGGAVGPLWVQTREAGNATGR